MKPDSLLVDVSKTNFRARARAQTPRPLWPQPSITRPPSSSTFRHISYKHSLSPINSKKKYSNKYPARQTKCHPNCFWHVKATWTRLIADSSSLDLLATDSIIRRLVFSAKNSAEGSNRPTRTARWEG